VRKLVFSLAILCSLLIATSLSAQATRTWVSGVGDDANPCSRTAPCKTFAGAISKTATCGEIDVLDPGGFGAVTITKSITIDGEGTMASILNSGVTGVLINLTNGAEAGACNTVILRNLSINGSSTVTIGTNAIRDISTIAHSVHIEHLSINNNQRGINIQTTAAPTRIFMEHVDIRRTTVHSIDINPSAGQLVRLSMANVRSRQSSGDGLRLTNSVTADITDSQFEQNLANGVNITSNSQSVFLSNTVMSNNAGVGLVNGGNAITHIKNCSISGNGTGLLNNSGGTVNGFFDNGIAGNGSDVVGSAVNTINHP
jgi:nitrous oxidase accessory protein NosD